MTLEGSGITKTRECSRKETLTGLPVTPETTQDFNDHDYHHHIYFHMEAEVEFTVAVHWTLEGEKETGI